MLSIYYKNHNPNVKLPWSAVDWHVGECFPPCPANVLDVEEVRADGDELDFIYECTVGVPFIKKPYCTWYGDMAKFIVGNLRNIIKAPPPVPQLEDEDYPEEVNHF